MEYRKTYVGDGSNTACYRTQLMLAEEELHKLDVDIALLLAKRSRAVKQISWCRASLAPCNRLPSELIREIIKLNMPELQPLPLILGKDDPRLQITQICSHWRNAAFGVNELWNNIKLNTCDRRSPVRLIAAWLRQCSSPKVTLKISGFARSFDTDCIFEELLLPHSHRFDALDSILTDANHFSTTPFDILSSLRLVYAPRGINPGKPMVAPLLRHFELTGVTRHPDHKLIEFLPVIPWKQLTSIHLAGWFTFGNVCDILSQCQALQVCRIDAISGISLGGIPHSVYLPKLKSLWIRFGSSVLFDELFTFVTPNLASLSVNHPPQVPLTLKGLSEFTDRCKNTLRHVEINKNLHDIRPTPPILQIMNVPRFITHLVSKECTIDLGTLVRIGTGELLPDLEQLEFLVTNRDKAEDIADALVPRYSNRAPRLKNVYMHTYQRYCSGERLRDLHDQGVDFWAVYRYPHVVGTERDGAVGTWTLL